MENLFSQRLNQLMKDRGYRQVDLIAATKPYSDIFGTKITKSDLSQYLSGRSSPANNKLLILAQTLNVNEAWLMGLDVPMERKGAITFTNITTEDQLIIALCAKLDVQDKKTVIGILNSLLANNPKYHNED